MLHCYLLYYLLYAPSTSQQQYAALLRIPGLSKAEKYKIVEETIDALRLRSCADTIIGDERNRGQLLYFNLITLVSLHS
jgi:hypothetical protein